MASSAMARGTIASLRQKIARIEGRLTDRLESGRNDVQICRREGLSPENFLPSGAARFDAALGGGLPGTGLTEIHAAGMHDASAATAFALALMRRRIEKTAAPFLWVGLSESFREAGHPYPPGISFLHGIDPSRLLVAEAGKMVDVLWIAEQAAMLDNFAAILLETRRSSAALDLTATRRLHKRALDAGHPLFLVRQTFVAEPTAAPLRLIVRSAPASYRRVLDRPIARSIGPPAFLVEINKNRSTPPSQFTLEWNPHARAFHERAAENPVPVVPLSQHGTSVSPSAGTLLAFPTGRRQAPAGDQPSGEKHPTPRRAG